jgi:hypothetical protein
MLRCRLLGLKGTSSIRQPEVEPCTVVISQNGKDLLVASCALCRARVEPTEQSFPVVPPTRGSCRALEACPRNKLPGIADRAAEVRTHPTRWVTALAGARMGRESGATDWSGGSGLTSRRISGCASVRTQGTKPRVP